MNLRNLENITEPTKKLDILNKNLIVIAKELKNMNIAIHKNLEIEYLPEIPDKDKMIFLPALGWMRLTPLEEEKLKIEDKPRTSKDE